MKSINRLQRLLQPITRACFDRLVQRHDAQRYVKRFDCWSQLTVLVFAQLLSIVGLRPLQAAINALHPQQRRSLGLARLSRSTLADANARCPSALFADTARSLMSGAQRRLRRQAKELVYLLDSTSITLTGRGFDDWAAPLRTRHTQGLKLHLLLSRDDGLPAWCSFTAPNVNDVTQAARHLCIQPGATYVFDKGYCHYNWWAYIDDQGARFVTRFKYNAALLVVRQLCVPNAERAIVLRDEIVRFEHKSPGGGRRNQYTQPLRRVYIAREDKAPLVLATNDLDASAADIAQLYKERWLVELFFKWNKQHLAIKRFMGRSENAVRTQILTALITFLLLQLYRTTHGLQALSLWIVLCQLRATLLRRAPGKAAPPPVPC